MLTANERAAVLRARTALRRGDFPTVRDLLTMLTALESRDTGDAA